jgi:sulfoxide reductase catalytic subunit YedY
MLIRKPADIPTSEITSASDYALFSRRRLITTAAGAAAATLFSGRQAFAATKLATVKSNYATPGEPWTPYNKLTTYNNFYEFGLEKSEPAKNAYTLRTRPWTIAVEGLVKKTQTFDIDALLKLRPIEERIYRHRCVEGWSMVIPWAGYSLSELINACNPLPSAKFVQFISTDDKKSMPDLPFGFSWPYSEGLRMDEAMNPLTLLAVGLYGEELPNQNGAPIRVVLPWKYGFKSAKSIVKIRFVDKQPHTLWNDQASNEYGFYSNVNPNVDHPRWSQKTERRIGPGFLPSTRNTVIFNGYGDQVASLYTGMDLRKYF